MTTPQPIKFPADENAHDLSIEWWYLNGWARTAQNQEFTFMTCLFQAETKKVKIPFLTNLPLSKLFFYHAVFSNLAEKHSEKTIEPLTIVAADSFTRPLLFINHKNPAETLSYHNRAIEEIEPFVYHLVDPHWDLILRSRKPALLEGDNGFLDLKSKTTYYYSLTDLELTGFVKNHDQWEPVTGQAWFDRQWAEVVYTKDKWTWFSLQLDNHTEIVCFTYDDNGVQSSLASLSLPDGQSENFTDLTLTPGTRHWQSAKTQASYPLDWTISLPAKNLTLNITAVLEEQEMVFGEIAYWEGPIRITGQFDGQAVTGQGFMELTNYASKYSAAQFVTQEIADKIKGFLPHN